jgi:hypothetical protein
MTGHQEIVLARDTPGSRFRGPMDSSGRAEPVLHALASQLP